VWKKTQLPYNDLWVDHLRYDREPHNLPADLKPSTFQFQRAAESSLALSQTDISMPAIELSDGTEKRRTTVAHNCITNLDFPLGAATSCGGHVAATAKAQMWWGLPNMEAPRSSL